MANTSVASLVASTRRWTRDQPDMDLLTASITSSGTTLTVADTSTKYNPSMTIEVDQEAMIVRAVASATTLTVTRGAFGSTAATHVNGSDVLLRPAWTTVQIVDALNAAIEASYPYVYQEVMDTSLTVVTQQWEYTVPNMPGTYGGDNIQIPLVYGIDIVDPGGGLPYTPVSAWNLRRDLSTSKIKLNYLENPGATLRVRGYGPFPDIAYSGNLHAGFPRNLTMALVEYAGSTLLMSGEAGRVRADTGLTDTRESAQRPGASLAAANAAEARFLRRLANGGMPPLKRRMTLGT